MIYRIYKETGRIGTGLEKIEGSLTELQDSSALSPNQIPLAAFDLETNTIHIFNDEIVDVTSLIQKFKNHGNLPNNHQFSIIYK